MIEELELRAEIAKAVKGEVSLAALYSWLMSRSWNMHKDSVAPAIDLANNLEDLFFDKADRMISGAQFRSELVRLLNNINESWALADELRVVPVVKYPVIRFVFGRFSSSMQPAHNALAHVPSALVAKPSSSSAPWNWTLTPAQPQS